MSGSSRRQEELTNAFGLHLRVATRFAELCRQFRARVCVSCNGRTADGGSVLELVLLAAGHGDRVEIEARGQDADDATAALCALIAGVSGDE